MNLVVEVGQESVFPHSFVQSFGMLVLALAHALESHGDATQVMMLECSRSAFPDPALLASARVIGGLRDHRHCSVEVLASDEDQRRGQISSILHLFFNKSSYLYLYGTTT
jgi:hypothetical protein